MPPSQERDSTPQTRREWFQEQAQVAARRAQALLDDRELSGARHWLQRAHRLEPDDAAIRLNLATLELRLGGFAAAADLLEGLVAAHDLREGWISLALARHRLGQPDAAATAMGRALSAHVLPPEAMVASLAAMVAGGVGAPGWCGLRPDGTLAVHAPGDVRIGFDGGPAFPGPVPETVRSVDVAVGGAPLLGSPLAVRAARRTEGAVWLQDGGIAGWAWHPGHPEAEPALRLASSGGAGDFAFVAADMDITAPGPLMQARGFVLPAPRLAGLAGPLRITGTDGRELLGSPLDPFAEGVSAARSATAVARRFPLLGSGTDEPAWEAVSADLRGPPAAAAPVPDRKLAVVIPAYRGVAATLACLDAVFATMPPGTRVVVVDDATPEPELAAALGQLARARRIVLLRHAANRGFPASANAGLRAAAALPGARDLVLLNSDTLVAPGWLEALRAAVHAAPDHGSATPLSNDATIVSYPDSAAENPMPGATELARLARLAAGANPRATVEIPTAVGFCMYIRRECLESVGVFREDAFAQGYGEENDFCIRARHLGWRHVAVPGVYVGHLGGGSFGAARMALVRRNLEVLERLHPGYAALIARFQAEDPLAPARRRLDLARWRTGRSRAGAVVLVTHDHGGGVERVVRARLAAIAAEGRRPILLRPEWTESGTPSYRPGIVRLGDATEGGFPNLRFTLPDELPALARLLGAERVVAVEVHHLLGHDHALLGLAARLGVPLDFALHDYAQFCPRVSLVRAAQYCGEPDDPAVCEACIADHGRRDEQVIGVAALRRRSAEEFAAARSLVVPSNDMAVRLRRHFPGLAPRVAPLETDSGLPARARPGGAAERVVCIIGAIGPEKGYDVLLACARDAAARRLALRFTLVGHTTDDDRLLDTGRVFITGPYAEAEAVALVQAQQAALAFLPSIWPETWCFTLGTAWQAGLDVAAFDLGAPAERIRATGRGWLLPLGLPAPAVNNALLALRRAPGDMT